VIGVRSRSPGRQFDSQRGEDDDRRMMRIFLVIGLLLTAASAQAALKFTYQRKHGDNTQVSTWIVDGERMRVEGMGRREGPGVGAIVVDGVAKKILLIDQEHKSYREITEASAKQMKERMDEGKARMAERMKSLPPDQRQRAEQMMSRFGGGAPTDVKYQSLGTKKTVAGFGCEMYRVQIGALSDHQACYAPWGSNLVTKAEAAQFKKLAADMEGFGVMGNLAGETWNNAPGIPIEQTYFGADGKTVEATHVLKSVTRGPAPAGAFEVPAGFARQEMPTGGPHRRGGMGQEAPPPK
jgi:hypothetical protein